MIRTRESALLSRAIQPNKNTLAPNAAKSLLQIQLDAKDRHRLHELAVKNQVDRLDPEEQRELQSYLSIGMLIDMAQAKARLALERRK